MFESYLLLKTTKWALHDVMTVDKDYYKDWLGLAEIKHVGDPEADAVRK